MVTVPQKPTTRLRLQLTRRERPTLNTMIRSFGAVAMVWALAGCSVGMAMSGKTEPNLGAFGMGSSRGQVEMQLGSAIASSTDVNGVRTDLYEYELGNVPSAGRAVGHAVMDVLTLGIWEIVGTPIEAFQGQKRQVSITYDSYDRVVGVNQPTTRLIETPAGGSAALDGQKPTCSDVGMAAHCPLYQYRPGIYRAKCSDGSGLEISLGNRLIIAPVSDVPRPWLAERCDIGGSARTAAQ